MFVFFLHQQDQAPRRHRQSIGSQTSNEKTKKPGINFFRLVAATTAWRGMARRSKLTASLSTVPAKPTIRLENTYRTEPTEGKTFMEGRIEPIIKEVLEFRLKEYKYNPSACKYLTKDLANLINQRVKKLEIPRYKLVSNVVIMENNKQSSQIVSRCVWNASTDNFATYTFKNDSIIASAYVYGVYFD